MKSLNGVAVVAACGALAVGGVAVAQAPPAGDLEIVSAQPDPTIITDALLRARIASTGFPWRIRDTRSDIEFVLVPPGDFVMGSDPSDAEAVAEEMPAHLVTLTQPFYLGRTEVTQHQWFEMTGTSPSYFGNRPDNPVERVSWNHAVAAGTQFGYRLPTEAEWEYACRGGVAASRYGPLNEIAWWGNGSGGSSGWGTNPVATKMANAYGLHDMIGNVWEYCSDFWAPYTPDAQVDPSGPASGSLRVGRSGDWYWPALGNRAPYRGPIAQDDVGLASLGVRFAVSPADTDLFDASLIPDCNGDGIVDYGQILDGTFQDANANGVPDCCDEGVSCDPCPGDVNFDGIVNGADISVTLGFWGLSGKPNNADINNDGIVNGADLAFVLGNWGPCP